MNHIFLAIASFLGLGLVFSFLEYKIPLHRKKINRFQWQLDSVYYFTGYFFNKFGIWLCVGIAAFIQHQTALTYSLYGLSQQPIILQLVEILVLSELGYYFAHRLLHQVPFLWQFHAIHHSAETMDWLTTTRVHPADQLFTKFFQLVPLLCLNFSPEATGIYFVWSSAIAFFIHANLNLKFPILRRIIVTPETHHWHHDKDKRAHHTNFAAQLIFVDLLFGTYYCPQKPHQDNYGITAKLPNTYLKQIIYPFRKLRRLRCSVKNSL